MTETQPHSNIVTTTPTWEPLHKHVGKNKAKDYMFMFSTTIPCGVTIHSYKHQDTREYTHLDDIGIVYSYDAVTRTFSCKD